MLGSIEFLATLKCYIIICCFLPAELWQKYAEVSKQQDISELRDITVFLFLSHYKHFWRGRFVSGYFPLCEIFYRDTVELHRVAAEKPRFFTQEAIPPTKTWYRICQCSGSARIRNYLVSRILPFSHQTIKHLLKMY